MDHTFSVGLRSGELPGQSIVWNWLTLDWCNPIDFLLLWQGAPSCRNLVAKCICLQGKSFSSSRLQYF